MFGPFNTQVFTETVDLSEIQLMLKKMDNIIRTDNTPDDIKLYTEEYIKGSEVSVHFLCNGTDWEYVGSARDYKKNFDGDIGPNTNGTGCYSPVEYFTDDIKEKVCSYIDKIIKYLNNMGIYYNGFMYLGVMIDSDAIPHILEINCRPGNPEFLTILDTIDNTNLLENLYRAATGLGLLEIKSNSRSAVAVGLINKEFPGPDQRFSSVKPNITAIPNDLEMYNHFTILINQNTYGFVTAFDTTKEQASNKIYNFLNSIETNDFRYRTDIGFLE
jgi:phosphoribosylamine--glycine ligase